MGRTEDRKAAKYERIQKRKHLKKINEKAKEAIAEGKPMKMTAMGLVDTYIAQGWPIHAAMNKVIEMYMERFNEDITERLMTEVEERMGIGKLDVNAAAKPLTPEKPAEEKIEAPVISIGQSRVNPLDGPGVLIKQSGLIVDIKIPIENRREGTSND